MSAARQQFNRGTGRSLQGRLLQQCNQRAKQVDLVIQVPRLCRL